MTPAVHSRVSALLYVGTAMVVAANGLPFLTDHAKGLLSVIGAGLVAYKAYLSQPTGVGSGELGKAPGAENGGGGSGPVGNGGWGDASPKS